MHIKCHVLKNTQKSVNIHCYFSDIELWTNMLFLTPSCQQNKFTNYIANLTYNRYLYSSFQKWLHLSELSYEFQPP